MNEPLDSRRLQTFTLLAATGSYRETAKRLFVTHSAVSHAIGALEADVGCRLLAKLGKKSVLTEAGEALLYHSQRALTELNQARQVLTQLNKWGSRRLRVAADAAFLSVFLRPVLVKFHKEFPKIGLHIEVLDPDQAFSRLDKQEVDVVLTEKPTDTDNVGFFPILTDRFHLVVKAGHPLAIRSSVPRAEFSHYPTFLLRDAPGRRKQLEDFLAKQKIMLNVRGEIDHLESVQELLRSTQAIGFLPGWCLVQELEQQRMVSLPYGRSVVERTWGLAYSRRRPLNLAESGLLKLCRKRAVEVELQPRHVVKVGVLHSLSGTMAISETSLRDVLLFAFDEINQAGGIRVGPLTYTIEPVVVDGASDWSRFAEQAKALLVEDRVAVTFGCWTSVSRKHVKPVYETENGLLFYPVQYEGEEMSRNIFYTAETVNQQAIPAVDYLLAQGRRKFYLIGTDYVYPQTINSILYQYLRLHGIPAEHIGGGPGKDGSGKPGAVGRYVPFGQVEFQSIIAEIKAFAASGDACVINTINGDSNIAFFRKIVAAGFSAAHCPIVSFSLAEDELRSLPARQIAGELGCWSYFMSLKTPANQTFLRNWYRWLKQESYPGIIKEKRAVDSPIILSYCGVHLWKKAVEQAGTFEVDAVRQVLESGAISFEGPGGKITVQANHHCTKDVYIGKTTAAGQFRILQQFTQVVGEPFVTESFLRQRLKQFAQ